jgi:hypothetical protein
LCEFPGGAVDYGIVFYVLPTLLYGELMFCSRGLAPKGFSLYSGHASTGGRPAEDMMETDDEEH